MLTLLAKLVRDDAGQDLAEYGIALAVIAVSAAAAAVAISGNIQSLWNNSGSAMTAAL